jgi:hypothetical protein
MVGLAAFRLKLILSERWPAGCRRYPAPQVAERVRTPCRFRYARHIVPLSHPIPRTNLNMHRTATSSGEFEPRCKPPAKDRAIMSEPFRPYEKLVEITIFGKKFQVPERNSLLRCFQFISPETIPYGRFCWNQDCQYCRVTCQLPDDDEPREMLSCKFIVMPGMEITEMSQELKWCLRSKLPSDAAVSK